MDKKGDQRRFMANRAPVRVSNATRVREMNEVKNYDRNQQQRVFDMSKRQVQSESESIKPIDAKDAGAAFKLQTYISKLQQILSQKSDLFSQLQTSPLTDLDKLKGTTKQASLLTMLVSKAEFVQSFNEMVAYVSLFFKDIQSDNRVRDRMYAAYFTPLIDQMRQLSENYPQLFATLPPPARAQGGQPPTNSGKVYDLVRRETRDMYSLLNVAADNIQDGIFRPIGAKDVAEYTRDQNVNATFSANPAPPGPVVPSMAVRQADQQIAIQQDLQAANQRAALAQAAEIAAQNPYDPRGDPELSPQQQQGYTAIQADIATGGLRPNTQFPIRSVADVLALVNDGTISQQDAVQVIGSTLGLGEKLGVINRQQTIQVSQAADAGDMNPLSRLIDEVNPAIQMYNDWVQTRGVLAPAPEDGGRPAPLDPSPRPAPGPADPPLQMASDADLDDVVRRWVQANNFPADSKIPTADSGKGELGGDRWRPLFGMERLLAEGGMRVEVIARLKAAIGRYNATIPKKKPGKKPKPGGSPAQPQQGQAAAAQPNYDSFQIAQANSAENRAIVSAILRAEEQKGGLLDSQSQTDADNVLNILERDNQNAFDALMASQNDDRGLARMDVVLPLVTAVNSAKRAAARNDGRAEGDYVGLGRVGRKSNAKAFLRGCGVPNDIMYESMLRHGLHDDSTIEDLEGSGIMDTLRDFGSSVADSASGWYDTIKNNMPTMSDVRRAVGKVVPDSFSDYVPSGLQRTTGDKVKDFFGFGRRQYSPQELDFVPGQMTQFNSAMPVKSQGYGHIHRPMFANEEEQLRAGGRYVRQDRVIYNLQGGLGMVNPDNEIGAYQVLRMAGEQGRGMSGGLYLPKEYSVQPAGEKEFFGYGVDGDNDVFGMEGGYGSLKRRLAGGMVNPFAYSRDYHYRPKDQSGYDDQHDFAYGNHEEPVEGAQQAHEEEEEKPVDLDENPNPFRVRNENYKVNTGKMKKVSYKMPNM